MFTAVHDVVLQIDVPLDYSLRQYVSVLYKVPRMQV